MLGDHNGIIHFSLVCVFSFFRVFFFLLLPLLLLLLLVLVFFVVGGGLMSYLFMAS